MLEITQISHTKNPDPVFPALYQARDFGEVFAMTSKNMGTCICQGARTHYKFGEHRHDLNVSLMAFYNGVLTLKQTGNPNDAVEPPVVVPPPAPRVETPKVVVDKEVPVKPTPKKKVQKMSDTYKKIKSDIVTAMKAKEAGKVLVLRGLDGAVQLKAKNDLVEIDEGLVIDVISKGIKQRNESIDAYIKGNRPDLVLIEQSERNIYVEYLPAQLTDDEIFAIVEAAITQVGATSIKDMGAVNKLVMPQIKGKADSKRVSELVKAKITGVSVN
jgi:uncharacterized protein YqeY